jgi:hypothetical protein
MGQNNRGPNKVAGHFGPGVLGREVFEEEQATLARQETDGPFGPGVLNQTVTETPPMTSGLPNQPVNRPGPGVTGQSHPPAPPAEHKPDESPEPSRGNR